MNEQTIDEIDTLRMALEEAENRGDPTVLIERCAKDAYRRMPPGRPPMDALETAKELEQLYAQGGFSVEWVSDGVIADDDLAIDGGTFTITWEADNRVRSGSWLMVFQRGDSGRWEIIRDIYNWDEPGP